MKKGSAAALGALLLCSVTAGFCGCMDFDADTKKPVIEFNMNYKLDLGDSIKVEYTATDNVGVVSETVTVKDANGNDVTSSVYDAATGQFTPTQAGTYSIIVEAKDAAGNLAQDIYTVTVSKKKDSDDDKPAADTQKPVIEFEMEHTLAVGGSLEVQYTATDNVGVVSETVTVMKDDTDVTSSVYDSETKLFTPTATGEYTITVEACDEAGNVQTATHAVTVTDTQKPVITLDSEMPGALVAGNSMQIKYTATDNVGVASEKVTVKKNDTDVTSSVYNSGTKLFTPTEAGEYTITVEAKDAAGNTAVKTHTVTVTAPVQTGYELPSNPNYGYDVSVHDPSIFYDDATQQYYAFGSHFAVASSSDLIHWTPKTWGDNHGKEVLYGTTDFRSILSQSDQLMGGDQNTWAPDVEKIGNTYYMYYSLTSGFGSSKSVIGRVSSDNVLGPYSNEEIIVWSTGVNSPNCIDPELFYDKNGGLWMVYGSFFAGIYIKELDPATGLPLENGVHDYGKLLWKGGGTGVEGPFIFYNAETDYYYLMTSDGSLSSDYNMRVARSKNPDGPYTDITGANMASSYGGGNKLAGNYTFSGDKGWAALGHNSVIKVDGQYLVVCHARYEENGGVSGGHNVQVRQLYFNADGWPVLAPNRYAGEKLGKVTASDIAGDYDLILHSTGNSVSFIPSERYTFTADGAVKKNNTNVGSWELAGGCYVAVTISGAVYKGVVAPCWNLYRGEAALCITATDSNGRSLWANVAAPSSGDVLNSLTIFKTVNGSVNNLAVGANEFNANSGIAVSFYLAEGNGDWDSNVITCGSEMRITLPNANNGGANNLYPGDNYNVNSGTWDCFNSPTTCYVTVSISKENGMQFYKDGVMTQNYPASATFSEGTSLESFIESLFSYMQTNGFTFAGGITADGLILSEAVTASQALALYNNYNSN